MNLFEVDYRSWAADAVQPSGTAGQRRYSRWVEEQQHLRVTRIARRARRSETKGATAVRRPRRLAALAHRLG